MLVAISRRRTRGRLGHRRVGRLRPRLMYPLAATGGRWSLAPAAPSCPLAPPPHRKCRLARPAMTRRPTTRWSPSPSSNCRMLPGTSGSGQASLEDTQHAPVLRVDNQGPIPDRPFARPDLITGQRVGHGHLQGWRSGVGRSGCRFRHTAVKASRPARCAGTLRSLWWRRGGHGRCPPVPGLQGSGRVGTKLCPSRTISATFARRVAGVRRSPRRAAGIWGICAWSESAWSASSGAALTT